MLERIANPRDEVSIGLVGKYTEYEDSYKSLKEALLHGGLAHELKVDIHWIDAEGVVGEGLGKAARRLRRHPGAGRASASAASTA
jgi:CTP synthase (UTP-ammonia lyase)